MSGGPVLTGAVLCHPPQTAVARDGVGLVEQDGVGDQDVEPREADLEVEVVVGHVHAVHGLGRGQVRRALDGAGEVAVGGREGRLPHLAELVEDVGDLGLVGLVVEEDDDALAGEDHAAQGGPVVQAHGDLVRGVDEVDEAGVDDGGGVVARTDEVGVAHEDGEDVVGVLAQPLDDGGQVGLEGADVEDVAGGVAEPERVVLPMGLELQHADAVVELGGDGEGLVGGPVAGHGEGAVVGGDHGDVGVVAVAELGVSIAGAGVGGQRGGGGGGGGGDGGVGGGRRVVAGERGGALAADEQRERGRGGGEHAGRGAVAGVGRGGGRGVEVVEAGGRDGVGGGVGQVRAGGQRLAGRGERGDGARERQQRASGTLRGPGGRREQQRQDGEQPHREAARGTAAGMLTTEDGGGEGVKHGAVQKGSPAARTGSSSTRRLPRRSQGRALHDRRRSRGRSRRTSTPGRLANPVSSALQAASA